jgi:hypothetical protein
MNVPASRTASGTNRCEAKLRVCMTGSVPVSARAVDYLCGRRREPIHEAAAPITAPIATRVELRSGLRRAFAATPCAECRTAARAAFFPIVQRMFLIADGPYPNGRRLKRHSVIARCAGSFAGSATMSKADIRPSTVVMPIAAMTTPRGATTTP